MSSSEGFEAEEESNSRLRLESRMHNYVTCLMDLAPTLKQVMGEKDMSFEDPRNASDIATFHVSQAARQYVLRIVDKYKNIDHGVAGRLGEANWQRYVRIQSRIRSTREGEGDDHGEIGLTAKSTFVPLSKFHDSGLGSSKPARSSYAASAASHTSFASTQSDAPDGRLRVPPTPPEVAQGLSFACYICGDVLTDVKNRIDWFDTETDFIIHHELDHSRYCNKLQLQATLSAARKYLPLVPEEQQCPLCLQSRWASQRKFVTHLGRHMEDIALASLPRDAASDSEAGSKSESDVDTQIVEDRYSPLVGPTPPIAIDDINSDDEYRFVNLSGQDEPLSSKTKSLRTKQVPRGTYDPVLGPESKISKSGHNRGSSTRGPSGKPPKSVANAQKRVFTCAFAHYGCEATFGSKNEWKRHVASQHLQLGFYRCDTGFCNPDAESSSAKAHPFSLKSYNDFNRGDLFTQHHRRMHTPWSATSREPSAKMKQDFEKSLDGVRKRCWHERRAPPRRSTCGFCRRVFEGPNGWDERMEHVGKHFERTESLHEEEDEDLREWALQEGIVKDYGTRGFWLVGMEPAEVSTTGGSSRRRGRPQQEDDEEDAEGENE